MKSLARAEEDVFDLKVVGKRIDDHISRLQSAKAARRPQNDQLLLEAVD